MPLRDARPAVRVRRRGGPARGVSPVIATVLLVSITIVLVSVLYYAVKAPLNPPPPYLAYQTTYVESEPAWGDAGDCTPGPNPTCPTLPALVFTMTQVQTPLPAYNSTELIFFCNGTAYLTGSLYQLTWNPANAGQPGGGAPQLQKCGGFIPPAASFTRLLIWHPLDPIGGNLRSGDALIVYVHSSAAWVGSDDDFHGTPAVCRNAGSCYAELLYTGAGGGVIATIPVTPPVS